MNHRQTLHLYRHYPHLWVHCHLILRLNDLFISYLHLSIQDGVDHCQTPLQIPAVPFFLHYPILKEIPHYYVDTEEDEEEEEVVNTKRKRGRPPNSTRQATQRDSWTFVTPTVWDVKQHQEPVTVHHSRKEEYVLLHWPQIKEQLQQEGQNTFTSTKMDTTLSMPKKKRGRKPKTQLEGNSCFVWRDLTARRGANKKKSTAK